jgi:hypothetical protein
MPVQLSEYSVQKVDLLVHHTNLVATVGMGTANDGTSGNSASHHNNTLTARKFVIAFQCSDSVTGVHSGTHCWHVNALVK